jgi:CRP/FNR family transcriptional regulator, cyclic AMP receptor protein
MDDSARATLATGHLVHFKKGELLFKENDDSHEFFIIKKGSIRVFRSIDQKIITLDTLGPGTVAGEIAIIDDVPRTASGLAVEDTDVLKITKQEFNAVFEKVPDWFRKIALILVQRLREVDEKISQSLDQDFSKHVAVLILMISYSEKCKQVGETFEIDKKFLEYEIMDLLAIPLSEVQNAIESLVKQDLLLIDKGKVVLTDRKGCEELEKELA